MKKILLIEPSFKNKYPPIGLMKLATYHKLKGDYIYFYKGISKELISEKWDIIYISTLFSFNWNITIKTIKFYSNLLNENTSIQIGGIMAELMKKKLKMEIDSRIIFNDLCNIQVESEIIENNIFLQFLKSKKDYMNVYNLPPDYDIFKDQSLPYKEVLDNSYIFSTTKGCSRGCEFCAVKNITKIEYKYLPIKPKIEYISSKFGERKDLILLDDNLLQSQKFDKIIDEIKDCGFYTGAKLNRKKRYVDFNQGLDLRLLKKDHISRFTEIPLKPLRFALDRMELNKIFLKKIRWLIDYGFREISIYMLYNFKDSPGDIYKRIELCVNLNEKYGTRIYSFPMKYAPINLKNRSYIGKKWTKRQSRGVQCILNSSYGIGPRTIDFFNKAFGNSLEEFERLIFMPENYIIKRDKNTRNGNIAMWNEFYGSLSKREVEVFKNAIATGKTRNRIETGIQRVDRLIELYKDEYGDYK